jgi:phosphate acetyltransferase
MNRADRPAADPDRNPHYTALLERARGLAPVRTAVVYPCSGPALAAALQAAGLGLIEPVLIGPADAVRQAADAAGLDIGGYTLLDACGAVAAASRAAALAAAGEVAALMKGSLHTDELMAAVVSRDGGLRTARRASHAMLMGVPRHPKPFVITDAAVNIAPDLATKRDIVQNAIDLMHALGVATPKVALLAAVETVNPNMPATLDAAALCKMAERGQITGGVLDGPLAFDNAISAEAARIKGIRSPVAGDPDILLAPALEAGNLLYKQLVHLSDAFAAGVVLGARVPVILTSRADSQTSRIASCALARLAAAGR